MISDFFSFLCEVGNGGEHRPALVVGENQDGSVDVLVFHKPSDGVGLIEFKPRVIQGDKFNQLSAAGNVQTDLTNTLPAYDNYGNPIPPDVTKATLQNPAQNSAEVQAAQGTEKDKWGNLVEYDANGNRIKKDRYGNVVP